MTHGPRLVTTEPGERAAADDGVRWLALLIRDALLMIVNGIEARYHMKRKRWTCPHCGHRAS